VYFTTKTPSDALSGACTERSRSVEVGTKAEDTKTENEEKIKGWKRRLNLQNNLSDSLCPLCLGGETKIFGIMNSIN
jgi:hypothetical protein